MAFTNSYRMQRGGEAKCRGTAGAALLLVLVLGQHAQAAGQPRPSSASLTQAVGCDASSAQLQSNAEHHNQTS